MNLSAGTRLGGYEIVSQLGAGGMGEVYRATDTRLHRDVAIKVLPPSVAEDRDGVARFRREAQVLAALNHPNVAAIYGVEESNGTLALVLELVDGEDLACRLERGPIPVDEAVAIARQIAEGLEAAHERGIVHRDLKPANVKVAPDGVVKVLDFGLARACQGDASSGSGLSQSPTMSRPMTEAGMILGTAAYMSPEQARGRPVDKRSDVWSFGVVLYEMLAGRRLFRGETVTDVLAAVLTHAPDWSALPPGVPAHVRALLARCLERDPKQRLRDVGEARILLSRPADASGDGGEAARPARGGRGRETAAWGVALAAVLAALVTWRGRITPRQTSPVRLGFEPPAGVSFDACQMDWIVVSPDGRQLVFTGRTADGRRQLWLRRLDSLEAHPLPDTDEPLEPFWSPDSRSIAFGAQGKLKRLDVAGGRATALADAPRLVGGSWSRNGVILFAPDFNTSIFRVSARGGEVREVTRPEPSRPEVSHRWPVFLPDQKHFLYWSGASGDRSTLLASLDEPVGKPLSVDMGSGQFAPPGWLVYARDGALVAHRFDARKLALSGDPVTILPAGMGPGVEVSGVPQHVSVSANGILVCQRPYMPDVQLTWFDRAGTNLGTVGPPARVALSLSPRLSPDGRWVAIQNREPQAERAGIWVIDIARGIPSRLYSQYGQFPTWSPDGQSVTYVATPGGVHGLYRQPASGARAPELVLKSGPEAGGSAFPADASGDGRFLVYMTRGSKTRSDIWALHWSGDGKPHPVLATEFDEQNPQLSPDGRWIAYRSDSSGTYEVYLQSFVDGKAGGERFRVSQRGGSQPRFRRDGKELFFVAADGDLMSVALNAAGAALELGSPKPLFRTRTLPASAIGASSEYDVTADGQRFLIGTVLDGPSATPPSAVVVLCWNAGLE